MAENLKVNNPSEAELDAWEEKYGELTCFEIDDLEFWFRTPARMIVEASGSFLFDRNMVGYNDFIINNTLLNHKELVGGSDKIRYALHRVVDQIITDKVATIKKADRKLSALRIS